MYTYIYSELLVIASSFILCGGRHSISQAGWQGRQVNIFHMIGDRLHGTVIASRALQLTFDFGRCVRTGQPYQHFFQQVAYDAPL
jgi:hypothetical protein